MEFILLQRLRLGLPMSTGRFSRWNFWQTHCEIFFNQKLEKLLSNWKFLNFFSEQSYCWRYYRLLWLYIIYIVLLILIYYTYLIKLFSCTLLNFATVFRVHIRKTHSTGSNWTWIAIILWWSSNWGKHFS